MTRRENDNLRIVPCLLILLVAKFTLAVPAPQVVAFAGRLQFVESWPAETNFDMPELAEAKDVWLQMITMADRTIDVEAFYFSGHPEGSGALAPILDALEEASGRGVRLRLLCDAGFYETYPEIPDRLDALPGAESRVMPARTVWGGAQHAKYFIVDGEQFFLGSQNWDWRALEHIRELGVRVQEPSLAAELTAVFELDWELASDTPDAEQPRSEPARTSRPPVPLITDRGDTVGAVLAVSPAGWTAGLAWDEPFIVELMDSARFELRLQLLSYNPVDHDGQYYAVLDNGLRRAAARGVEVKVLLANWAKRSYMISSLQSLAACENIEIRFSNIPEWSGGFIPYARVEHAKYLVADTTACWLGTANWERSYFYNSRNVSLLLQGTGAARTVVDFFEQSWQSPYAEKVDPCRHYAPPRIGR